MNACDKCRRTVKTALISIDYWQKSEEAWLCGSCVYMHVVKHGITSVYVLSDPDDAIEEARSKGILPFNPGRLTPP